MVKVRNYRKIVCIKSIFENGWWEHAYPSSYPSGSAPGINYRNHQKNLAYFNHLAPLGYCCFCLLKGGVKKGGAWHNGPAPKYAHEDRLYTMRGPRLFDHTDWKSKKGLYILRCPVFTENISIVKSKKRYTRPQMFSFPLKVSVKKKKVFIFVMRPPVSPRP